MGAAFRRSALAVLLAACAFGGGAAASRFASAENGPYDVVRDFGRALVLVENEYVDPVERSRLLEGAVKGMVAELDPHSSYLPPEDFRIFESDTRGEFAGIGVEVDFQNETVVVIAPIEGSPAERAGILPGDRIVAIDASPVRGQSMQELIRRMRGKAGTRVVVSLNRGKDDTIHHYALTREIIQVASVAAKALDDGIAYLRIKQFQSGTHDELLQAVGKLRDEVPGKITGVLLDLRNNPGGLVDEASAVADEFLADGVIYTTRRRGKTLEEVRAGRGGALSREPLVVLVNEYSASAAELVAGALQDHRRGTVVGARTFGKGSVQTIIDLPSGAGLRLTTMRYYTPGGHAIQAQGVKPDVQVEAAYAADKTFGVIRESDLEGHLPAEGAEEPKTAPETTAPGGADGGTADTHLGVAREIPNDPTGGKDFALSIGFQILRGVLKR
jgi:carboxyl-terminal processing protease